MNDIGPRERTLHAMAHDSARDVTILFGGSAAATGAVGDTWQWDGQDWTQLLDSGPPRRISHALAFDSIRNRMVLFGGAGDSIFQDTWELDGQDWTQREDTGPPACSEHGMAFDSVSERVILFGGIGGTSGTQTFGDTWAWDGRDVGADCGVRSKNLVRARARVMAGVWRRCRDIWRRFLFGALRGHLAV